MRQWSRKLSTCLWSWKLNFTNPHTLTQAKFILEDRDAKLAAWTLRGGVKSPQKVGITAVDIFIRIDLLICGWLGARCVWFLTNQFQSRSVQFVIFMAFFWLPVSQSSHTLPSPTLFQDPRPFFRDQKYVYQLMVHLEVFFLDELGKQLMIVLSWVWMFYNPPDQGGLPLNA